MAQMLDGKLVASSVKDKIKEEVSDLVSQGKRLPKLSVVIVGEDPASKTYVASKARQCKEVGFDSVTIRLPESSTQEEVLEAVTQLNQDDSVDGILVQLPLPKHMSEDLIIDAISPSKDVDGLHPLNMGYLQINRNAPVACTPKGIIALLDYYNIELEGASCLVIGRSRLVGKPVAGLLTNRNATVTIAHSRSKDLEGLIASHDIIVVAVGIPHFVKASSLKEHHIVVDVGIHRGENGLIGDVEGAGDAAFLSPVPGGVGPMTIASLLSNTLEAYYGS